MFPVFVTGGTGYVGRPLIESLAAQGYPVLALVRPGSRNKLPRAAMPVLGDALDESTYADAVPAGATFVHLVGAPHPNPFKAAEFRRVDLASVRAATAAALRAHARHLVYVSVAQPAPVMRAYIAVRKESENLVRATGIPATVLRPWYVLGPGHWWPCVLLPFYVVARQIPAVRPGAERLGLVSLTQMVRALERAVAEPPDGGVRIVEVPEITGPATY